MRLNLGALPGPVGNPKPSLLVIHFLRGVFKNDT